MHGTALTAESYRFEQSCDWGLGSRSAIETSGGTGQTIDAYVLSSDMVFARGRFRVLAVSSLKRNLGSKLRQIDPILVKLGSIAGLADGWNSHGAMAIRNENLAAAVQVLLSCLPEGASLPQVVPTTRGGLQLEWHTEDAEVEIYITSPSNISFFASDRKRQEEELPLNSETEGALSHWISMAR